MLFQFFVHSIFKVYLAARITLCAYNVLPSTTNSMSLYSGLLTSCLKSKAKVVVDPALIAIECLEPAAIDTISSPIAWTCRGINWYLWLPWPSWPLMPHPHVKTSPSFVSTTLCKYPQATVTAVSHHILLHCCIFTYLYNKLVLESIQQMRKSMLLWLRFASSVSSTPIFEITDSATLLSIFWASPSEHLSLIGERNRVFWPTSDARNKVIFQAS